MMIVVYYCVVAREESTTNILAMIASCICVATNSTFVISFTKPYNLSVVNSLKPLLKTSPRKYPKNNIILFQGEAPRSAFLINSGIVKVYAIDNRGNSHVVNFLTVGDVFPLDWLYGTTKATIFYYETLTQSELVAVDKALFTENCLDNIDFIKEMNGKLQLEASTASLRNLAYQQPLAQNKILYLFYFFAIRYGREFMPGLYNLGLPLTHQLIAECLGLTRETVSVEVSKLKKTDAIIYRQKLYIVDKKLLIKVVGKDISDNF